MAIFTLIGGAISAALFGGSALAASLIGGALSFGTQLLLSYRGRPKPQAQTAIRGNVRVGAGLDCAILMGEDKVKGQLLYYAKWGAGNSRNAYVKQLSDGWCQGLAPYVYVFGAKVNLIAQTPVGTEHARYTLEGWGQAIVLRFYDGRPGQQADSELVAATSALESPWRSTSRGTNKTLVVEDLTYDSATFSRGVPEITYVLRGLREYDARKDSTVPGGSGAHRLGDPSTWEFTQNNAVHRLNYLIGHKGRLSGETIVGVGKQIDEIDLPMHMLAANVCDTERTVEGRTIPTYHCNQWASAGDDHLAVLKNIEDAMAGYAVNSSGLDGVLAGAPQIPVRAITKADIRVDDKITGRNRRPVHEGFNVLSGQFSSKETGFEPEGLKTATINADVAADGGKRLASNDFLQVSDPDIAQYLLNIRYRQNRKARQRLLPVSRRLAFAVQLGEWVTYEGRTWLVTNWGFDGRFRFVLGLSETGADVYSEDGIEPGPVVLPKITPINPSLISTVAGFDVSAGLITGQNGSQVPALEFVWDPPGDPTIVAVRIEYRKAGTTEPVFQVSASDVESGKLILTQSIQSLYNYEARATISPVPDRLKTWTPWKTTEIATPSAKMILAELAKDVYAALETLRAQADDLEVKYDLTSGNASIDTLERYVDRVKIQKEQGALRATVIKETQARVDGDEALASELTVVQAVANSNTAAVANEIVARSNADSALASAITQVQAKADAGTASGLIKWEAVSAPAGVSARFSIYGKASAGGSYMDGGALLDITPYGAYWNFYASQFNIMKPSGELVAVFGWNGISLVLQSVKVGWADIEGVSIGSAQIAAGSITNAKIANAAITSAKIGYLEVGESNISLGSITAQGTMAASNVSVSPNGAWQTIGTITISNPSGRYILLKYAISQAGDRLSGGPGVTTTTRLRNATSGSVLALIQRSIGTGAAGSIAASAAEFEIDDSTTATTVTYVVEQLTTVGAFTTYGSCQVKFIWGKR